MVLNAYTPSLEERSVEEHNVTSLYCQEKYEKLFSMQEVAAHCEPDSLWIVVDNIVYDVTQFSFEVFYYNYDDYTIVWKMKLSHLL